MAFSSTNAQFCRTSIQKLRRRTYLTKGHRLSCATPHTAQFLFFASQLGNIHCSKSIERRLVIAKVQQTTTSQHRKKLIVLESFCAYISAARSRHHLSIYHFAPFFLYQRNAHNTNTTNSNASLHYFSVLISRQ